MYLPPHSPASSGPVRAPRSPTQEAVDSGKKSEALASPWAQDLRGCKKSVGKPTDTVKRYILKSK